MRHWTIYCCRRNLTWKFSVLVLMVALLPQAASIAAGSLDQILAQRGSLTLRDTPLSEAVFTVSRAWNVNIVVGQGIEGTVSGVFVDAPLGEVLDSILLANGYGYQRRGESLIVLNQDAMGVNGPGMQAANSQGGGVAYFSPQFVDVMAIEKPLQDVLGSAARVSLIATENRILVVGSPSALQLAHDVVARLDVPRQQVRITAYIYDISLGEMERLGVDWSQRLKSTGDSTWLDLHGGLFGTTPVGEATTEVVEAAAETAATVAVPNQLVVQTLGDHFDLHSVVQALDETRGARLLADPNVTVIDREEAVIRIVTKVPVQQLTQTEMGGNIGTTTFEEAGVTLTVTPFISDDRTIRLKVAPTFSVLAGYKDSQPIIDAREASTIVRVADRQTLVLGGLRQRSEVETVRGVPRLMKLRLIGRLFRSHETEIRESELIVFIQPEIVPLGIPERPREGRAECVCKETLDRIPYAEDTKFIPNCRDCACPYHHPRSRINGGSSELGSPDGYLAPEMAQDGFPMEQPPIREMLELLPPVEE